jgi:hypothetical protein
MTRKLKNWSYSDVTEFLKEREFSFSEDSEGVQVWVKLNASGEPATFVEIGFRRSTYPVKVLRKVIRQSEIAEKVWTEWAGL